MTKEKEPGDKMSKAKLDIDRLDLNPRSGNSPQQSKRHIPYNRRLFERIG